MEDDSDVDIVETVETDKPLLILFKRLIDKTAKAILTNTQITHILQQEFDIECSNLHPLELNIYIDIMKKFLKDWPQWDEFDRTINRHKAQNDEEGIKQLLEMKHKELKDYLTLMLQTAKKTADKTVQEAENILKEKKRAAVKSKEDSREIVMEVQCTRSRLNQLFYDQPNSELNDTIFNIGNLNPSSKISVSPPTYQSILNWWNVQIQINLNRISMKRSTVHEFKHVLVNKKLGIPTDRPGVLDTRLQEKIAISKPRKVPKTQMMEVLENLKTMSQITAMKNDMEVLLWFLRDDIKRADETVAYPSSYRRYMNKYPYVRYLSTKINDSNRKAHSKYDLALEETISPMYMYTITKFEPSAKVTANSIEELCRDKVSVKCEPCGTSFEGMGLLKALQQHFWSLHMHEADWQCTNCKQEFKMAALSGQRWTHDCIIDKIDR